MGSRSKASRLSLYHAKVTAPAWDDAIEEVAFELALELDSRARQAVGLRTVLGRLWTYIGQRHPRPECLWTYTPFPDGS